jgi:hypothetical protein
MSSITDNIIRNYNSLSNPPLFQQNGNNININRQQLSLIDILSVDDTWHDLAKDRAGYNSTQFKETIANYLMTTISGFLNQASRFDNIANYKNIINGAEFQQISGGTFENKVAKTFEIKQGLQPANITVTYEHILINVSLFPTGKLTVVETFFENYIIKSNGSLILLPDITDSSVTYSNWISDYCSKNAALFNENDVNRHIAIFIKWYMYAEYKTGTFVYDLSTLLDNSMKVLFDGGQFHLKEICSVVGSGITPFLSTASIMDSAGTSTGLLDPNIQVYFPEEIDSDKFYPMFSNYFTSNNLVTGYMINPGQIFGQDGTACFSFIIFLNDEQAQIDSLLLEGATEDNGLRQSIDYIRTGDRDYMYNQAIDFITLYVNTYPQKIARWYFGQISKKGKNNPNDFYSACGVSGAGVSYIGQIFSVLNTITTDPNITRTTGQKLIDTIAGELNNLKSLPTRSSIPISDARILNLFYNINTNSIDPTTIIDKLPILYGLLADYKREGDYNQIHEVLTAILQKGINDQMFTFSTGDELAALISRLCGLPTILQWAGGGRTTLYRSDNFSVDESARMVSTLNKNNDIINDFFKSVVPDLQKITFFLQYIGPSLHQLFYDFLQVYNNNGGEDDPYIWILSKFELLSKMIIINNLMNKVPAITGQELITLLGVFINYFNLFNQYYRSNPDPNTQIEIGDQNTEKPTLLQLSFQILDIISKISNHPSNSLYDDVIGYFPIIQTIDFTQENITSLQGFFTKIDSTTFDRKIFNLKFKNGLTQNRKLVAFANQLRKLYPQGSSRRTSPNNIPKDEMEVKAVTKKFNELISEFPSEDQEFLVESLGNDPPLKITSPTVTPPPSPPILDGIFPNTLTAIENKHFPQGITIISNDSIDYAVNELSKSITALSPPEDKPQDAGKNKNNNLIIQIGGNPYSTIRTVDSNRRYCYNKIQSYVLKIFSKCNDFLLNTFNNIIRDNNGNSIYSLSDLLSKYKSSQLGLSEIYTQIYIIDTNLNEQPLFKYQTEYITQNMQHMNNALQNYYMIILYYLTKYSDINTFFTNLLFNIGENSENNGLYSQIRELSSEFTEGMLKATSSDTDKQLSISEFLIELNLLYVRDLLLMLSIQIPDNNNSPDFTQYINICQEVAGVSPTTDFLPDYYKILLQPNLASNGVLLLSFGLMYITFEGGNTTKFNENAYIFIYPIIKRDVGIDSMLWFESRPGALAFFDIKPVRQLGEKQGSGSGAGYSINLVQQIFIPNVMSILGVSLSSNQDGGKKTKKRKNKKHSKITINKNKKKQKKSKIKRMKRGKKSKKKYSI